MVNGILSFRWQISLIVGYVSLTCFFKISGILASYLRLKRLNAIPHWGVQREYSLLSSHKQKVLALKASSFWKE